MAAAGVIRLYFATKKAQQDRRLAQSQAEMVRFNEGRGQLLGQPRVS